MTTLESMVTVWQTADDARRAAAVALLTGTPLPATEGQLLTVAEVCARLKLSRSTVWRMKLPTVHLGGAVRFRESDITKLIEGRG